MRSVYENVNAFVNTSWQVVYGALIRSPAHIGWSHTEVFGG
jgi:hypothetical protein